ncbi:MAG: DNA-formamidopyrimidine glycosylase [Vulcanimicrobiaceae bacterium]
MPELPEVETIARGLQRAVVGKMVASAVVLRPSVVEPEAERFAVTIAGERIAAVGRRAKYVVFSLVSGRELVVHLRMTGRLIVQPAEAPALEPYTNVALAFADGTRLCFADVRRFGRMRLYEAGHPWRSALGVEPLSDAFSIEHFAHLVAGRATPIKVFLLDQRRIAGIGNIYACEALWQARVRPSRAAGTLSRPARQRLHASIRDVLARAIDLRGTTVDDYVDADGLRGGFQNVLSVYGRDGAACGRCARPIVRTVVAQRGTWWCRSCQA